jgi:hypothetical protein
MDVIAIRMMSSILFVMPNPDRDIKRLAEDNGRLFVLKARCVMCVSGSSSDTSPERRIGER